MEESKLKTILEAMLFASNHPLSLNDVLEIFDRLAQGGKGEVDRELIRSTWKSLVGDWYSPAGGIVLQEVAGGYQLRTMPEASPWVQALMAERPSKLSQPALETLAIVAYQQPITRAEIEHIRGVDSGGVLRGLLDRRFLRIVGKKEEPGRPLLYGTTQEFLEIFGLKGLAELPTLKSREELERLRQAEFEKEGVPVEPEEGSEGESRAGISSLWDSEEQKKRQTEWRDEEEEAIEILEDQMKAVGAIEKEMVPAETPHEGETRETHLEGGDRLPEEG